MANQLGKLVKKADAVANAASVLVNRTLRQVRASLWDLSDTLNLAGSADDRDYAYEAIRRKFAWLSCRLDALLEAQNELAAKGAAKDAAQMTGLEIKYSAARANAILELVTPAQGENLAAVFTQRMAKRTIDALREATVSALREQAVIGGTVKSLSKGMTTRWAAALNDTDPKFVDSAGHVWDTKQYFQMNARTNTMRVYNDCLVDNVTRETGSDLMRISTGGDPDCDCFAWEGCIISVSGKTKGFPTYEDARRGGCFHPNCTHTLEYVDEVADADEIELQKQHPVDADKADDPDAQDERRYEIDQARKMRDEGLTKEQARVAVDRDNLTDAIRSGLVREDAHELVAKLTDEQVTRLCPEGNPPAFVPAKGSKRKPEPERWNHGSAGGVVHIKRDADLAHLLAVTKADRAEPPRKSGNAPVEPPKAKDNKSTDPKKEAKPKALEEVLKMPIQDALKLKQIADIVPDAVKRFEEAERLNNADKAKIKEIDDKFDALFALPVQERKGRLEEFKKLQTERAKAATELKRKEFERNVAAFGFTENNCTVREGKVSKARSGLFASVKGAIEKLYAAGVFPDRPLTVNATHSRRSYHQTGTLFLSESCDPSTGVHEVSHFVEFGNSHVHERCLEFLRYRTAGEAARQLRQITGNTNYRQDEMARPDKFFNPYCGKDYGDRATEILSMGVERLTRDPKKFYSEDPEYFRFCVGIMRGQL